MKCLIAIGLLFASFAVVASAQTVSPIITQAIGEAQNQIKVENNGIMPMVVTMEPLSFSIDESGQQAFRLLDQNISIQFSETSFRLPAKQSHTVFYTMKCAEAPCHAAIYSTFLSPRPKGQQDGIQLALHVPSIVYVLGKDQVKRQDIAASWVGSDLVIENHSSEFVRLTGMTEYVHGKKLEDAGFPLFGAPEQGHTRRFSFKERPDRIVLHFPKFNIDSIDTIARNNGQ